jgi:hypothetical protein
MAWLTDWPGLAWAVSPIWLLPLGLSTPPVDAPGPEMPVPPGELMPSPPAVAFPAVALPVPGTPVGTDPSQPLVWMSWCSCQAQQIQEKYQWDHPEQPASRQLPGRSQVGVYRITSVSFMIAVFLLALQSLLLQSLQYIVACLRAS